jgi:hypothetical protein
MLLKHLLRSGLELQIPLNPAAIPPLAWYETKWERLPLKVPVLA